MKLVPSFGIAGGQAVPKAENSGIGWVEELSLGCGESARLRVHDVICFGRVRRSYTAVLNTPLSHTMVEGVATRTLGRI
jgi:hypothetical protein